MLDELNLAIDDISNDAQIYVLVITDAGKAFVTEVDIARMKDITLQETGKFA
jgi:enoyl-CoA hydratase